MKLTFPPRKIHDTYAFYESQGRENMKICSIGMTGPILHAIFPLRHTRFYIIPPKKVITDPHPPRAYPVYRFPCREYLKRM
jgi:hypothetical protein